MANLTVYALDVIASHVVSAAQVRIPGFPTEVSVGLLSWSTHQVGRISPHEWAGPIRRPPIETVIIQLELSRNRFVTNQARTIFNLFFGQIDGDVLLLFTDGCQRIRRDQNLSAKQPVSCLRDQIAYRPVLVIEEEFFDFAYFAIKALQRKTVHCFGFYKHDVCLSS